MFCVRSYFTLGVVSANAWFWAAVFHTRDSQITETLDYHSATAIQVASLICAFARVFRLDIEERGLARIRIAEILRAGVACAFVAHVVWLTREGGFDYGYNILFNISFGTATAILWLSWLLWPSVCRAMCMHGYNQCPQQRPNSVNYELGDAKLLLFIGGLGCCVLLELLDFPDIRMTTAGKVVLNFVGVHSDCITHSGHLVSQHQRHDSALITGYGALDAHALWHATTVLLTPIWYSFVVSDSGGVLF